MTCNNSALNPNIVIQGAGGVGSKTAITVVQNNHGFSAGTAVRWNSGVDGTAAEYRAAQANNAYNAEVVGIVSQKYDANSFELCLGGVVKMNDFFSNTTGSINEGATADDVYFLGGYTAGWLDNRRPTTPGWVAKPVITRIAEDVNGDIFGSVTNYVGSLLGGSVAVSLGEIVPAGVVHAWAGSADKVPTGWAICNGDGQVDQFGVPGINRTTYPFYHDTVGKRYGWVECLKVDTSVNVGDRLQQIVADNTRTIEGVVVGASGGIENGGRYIFVEQSLRSDITNANQNFETLNEFDSITKGGSSTATFKRPKTVLYEFEQGNATLVGGGNVSIINDTSNKTGVFTSLTPDLRERLPLGESDSDARGRVGGDGRFDMSNDGAGAVGFQTGAGGFGFQSNLSPYVSMNYIIRIDPSASAAIIDTLEVKNLRLTNLPTTGSGSVTDTVFSDSGTLKIVT